MTARRSDVIERAAAAMRADGRLSVDVEREHHEIQALIARARAIEAACDARLASALRKARRRASATARLMGAG